MTRSDCYKFLTGGQTNLDLMAKLTSTSYPFDSGLDLLTLRNGSDFQLCFTDLMMVAMTCGGFIWTLSFPPTRRRTVALNRDSFFNTWGGCCSTMNVLQPETDLQRCQRLPRLKASVPEGIPSGCENVCMHTRVNLHLRQRVGALRGMNREQRDVTAGLGMLKRLTCVKLKAQHCPHH